MPVNGLINLTVRCNQDCIFCCDGDVKESGHHLTLDETKGKIDGLARQGAQSITFIGGEPLIRKDIVEIVEYTRRKGMRSGITSNATPLTETLLGRLVDAGLTSFEVSMHGAHDETICSITRKSFSARKQRRALGWLKKCSDRLSVSINFVVFSLNHHELPEFVDQVATRWPFVEELFINFVDPIGYPGQDHSLVPRYSDVKDNLVCALDKARNQGLSFTVDTVPGCVLGTYFLYLRATREKLQGVRYAKDTLRITNPTPDPDQSQYYRVNSCFACPVSGLCPGVNFRYLAIHGPGEFSPFPRQVLEENLFVVPEQLAHLPQSTFTALPPVRAPAVVTITDRCNNRCPDQCPCKASGFDPSTATKALEKALAGRNRRVLLDGGEPATHPAFFKMLRLIARSGKQPGFVTNGRVFSLAGWTRKAHESGAEFVRLRLPAPLSHLDAYTGVTDALTQTESGIRNLLDARAFHITAELHVPQGTESGVQETVEYLQRLGIVVDGAMGAQ
jgi:MoaA/NifB/PqqE/SkfB family radical SAM enzyme